LVLTRNPTRLAEAEFLKGSPRVALDIANPFTSYIFIERDTKRLTELTKAERRIRVDARYHYSGGRRQRRASGLA
jgi:hypothetical protein